MLLFTSEKPMGRFEHEYDQEHRGRTHERAAGEEARSRLAPEERVATDVGNQAFSAFARDGGGILPDGRAHPDVEAAIARTRGGGGSLAADTRAAIEPHLGDSLDDVRVHTDGTADSLARSVSARAFATGSDVYFARGEYRPGTSEGDRLLAHELSHVVQQRGAAASGPLLVSQPGDAYEVEADRAADDIGA
jgi:hypothetical protein